jgi:hypothetical protein
MKVNKPKPPISFFNADWKDSEGLLESLDVALKKLGVNMYFDPTFEDSDHYGFILSKQKLSKEEIERYSREELGEFDM